MKFFASFTLAAVIGLAEAYITTIRVTQDATVAFNGMMCDDNVPCNSIPFGLNTDLTSFKGNRDYERILLGFDLPANLISKCILKIPHPIEVGTPGEYTLTATVTDNDWAEDSVVGASKKNDGTQVGYVKVQANQTPDDIDITSACQEANGGKLSLFVDANFSLIRFHSIQSGSPAIFSLDVTY
ncbi:hypothetical protein BGZ82_002095 [Podila clonocystis]|nr:hypothetical protein BGZ82_002095 [Podila clonocystis]